MKIRRVFAHTRKKAFVIETERGVYEFPFTSLTLRPTPKDPVSSVLSDPELGYEAFTYALLSGKEDSVLLEQVLEENRDPTQLRENLLYKLSIDAQKQIRRSKISKRALARRIGIAPAQLYRLIDPTFYGKTIDQMQRLFCALGIEMHVSLSTKGKRVA